MLKQYNKIIDAENGLVLINYKEPLLKNKGGYGYMGAITTTMDGTKIQCHICGKLYASLSFHTSQSHGMNAQKYKETYDLAHTTSLISETEREQRKLRTVAWHNSLSEDQKVEMKDRALKNFKKYLKEHPNGKRFKIRLETKNKRGTCPDQLLQKIRDVSKELGHTPSKIEFIHACDTQRYVHLIYLTFGSWTKAVEKAGLQAKEWHTTKGQKRPTRTNEELLDYLKIFYQETNKIPTETDCRRGMIPASSVYARHFGSLPKARELAGLPAMMD